MLSFKNLFISSRIRDKGKILVKGVARDRLYELLCMLTHMSGNKVTYVAMLSSSSVSKSINCISNLVSMLFFNSSYSSNKSVGAIIGASVIESGRVDKSCSRI